MKTDAFAADRLSIDPARRDAVSHDVFVRGASPAAVLRPTSIDELVQGVKAAAAQGLALVPRGGGMSYTGGYVADRAEALAIDLSAMNRVLEINAADMTVTVEAGITWQALYEALKPLGLRTPAWGTMSGIKASVGGGMGQNGTFWGANHGPFSQNVISLTVVLADGTVMETGCDFARVFGPDLTGLFTGDAGALGIKAHVTMPLIREAEAFAYGSFAFDAPADYCAAMSEIARSGLASESFGFDPYPPIEKLDHCLARNDAAAWHLRGRRSQGG